MRSWVDLDPNYHIFLNIRKFCRIVYKPSADWKLTISVHKLRLKYFRNNSGNQNQSKMYCFTTTTSQQIQFYYTPFWKYILLIFSTNRMKEKLFSPFSLKNQTQVMQKQKHYWKITIFKMVKIFDNLKHMVHQNK